jgi:phosphoesterase RecJ-like protein
MDSSDISPIIREKAPLILAEIKKAKSILLHCHPSPDPDSVGSALAMKFALEGMGKKTTVIKGDSDIPQAFMHFPGADQIVQKSFFEVDLKEFDLFIIQDSGSLGMISRIQALQAPLPIRTIIIDHHISNDSFADVNLVDTSAPAVAFMLFQLFKEWGVKINHDIALDLFIGMYTDSGGFKYSLTDYRVLQAASDLARLAPDFPDAIFSMENSNTPESLYFEALALGSIQTFLDGNVAMASVSFDEIKKKGIKLDAMKGDGIANKMKSVIGWNVGVLLVEIESGKVKAGFRTRDNKRFDVSKLAVALGGGGHKSAAGAILNMPLPEAKALVVAKAKELYNL